MKIIQKGMMLIFILMMTATVFAAFPEITQTTYTPSPALPGTTITVFVQLENKETLAKTGVTLTLENQYPFTVKPTDDKPNPATVGNMGAYGKSQTQFTVYVDPTAETTTYSLPITITTDQDASSKKTNISITVSGKEPIIKVVTASSDKLLPGEEKEINFTLQNVGTSPAYDVILEMQEDRTVTATGTVVERDITPLGAAAFYINSINPGEQKEATLKVSVTNTATIKNYTLPIKVSYRNSAGTRTTDTSYVGLKVFGTADLDATLKEITRNGKIDVTIELFNKGLGKAEFTLVELEGSGLTLDKPKQFIGSLGPNDVDTIKTAVVPTTGEQKITVKITYQDSDSSTKTKTIEIPLKIQPTTTEGPNLLLILVVVIVIGLVGWNFFIRKKKK